MINFTNCECAACKVKFGEKDDIVSCPVCGSPHHRDCWTQTGECANSALHDEGFVFTGHLTEVQAQESDRVCLHCGRKLEGSMPCPDCGAMPARDNSTDEEQTGRSGATYNIEGEAVTIEQAFEMHYGITDATLIEGVPVGDIKKFIGSSWYMYIPAFHKMSQKKSAISLSVLAFIGNWMWLVLRKMYWHAAAVFATIALSFFYTACYSHFLSEYFGSDSVELSVLLASENQYVRIGMFLYYIMLGLQFIAMLVCGLFGNRMYMNFCIRKIKKINKKSSSAEEFNAALEKAGGMSSIIVLFLLAVFVMILFSGGSGLFESGVAWVVDKIMPLLT